MSDVGSSKIGYRMPSELYVNENFLLSETSLEVDVLMRELQARGPCVVKGVFGPDSYSKEKPCLVEELDSTFYQAVYGWKKGAEINQKKSTIMILGAEKVGQRGYVYFTMVNDISADERNSIRRYAPSMDPKIYVISNDSFNDRTIGAIACKCFNSKHQFVLGSEALSTFEMRFLKRIAAVPLKAPYAEKKESMKAIGQDIFAEYISRDLSSEEAVNGLGIICNAIKLYAEDGRDRYELASVAWDGVGDSTEQFSR